MERVTRAEAARALALHRATITRIVNKNPALLDADGRLDLDELRELRDATVNPALQTRGRQVAKTEALNDSRARAESVKAELAEMELAERLGLTLRREEVEAAVASAGAELRQLAFQMARDRAEAIATETNVRTVETMLEALMRDLLDHGANALTLAAAQPGSRNAA